MPMTMVVVPTYNERENLPLLVEALWKLPVEDLQLLVVDDNSPDGTGRLADELAAQHPGRIHVLHRKEKAGLGPAYRAGFRVALASGADYVIQMDCDFSHDPKYLPALIAAADSGADVVLGSRYAKGGSVDHDWPIYRKLLSGFANLVYVRTILRVPFRDSTGGFRLWRAQTVIGLDLDRLRSNGYVSQVELAYITYKLGYRTVEVPIHFPERQRGTSKMNMRIQLEAAVRVWQIWSRHHRLNPSMRRSEPYSL
ncbi:MAG TPA: polyprenol monophosphomannose synthase [Candidatus Limnocylindrales bacterium]|nr:polyprenol monophosphomannose synthase [Candidatus Limnocylindrales bacterium]